MALEDLTGAKYLDSLVVGNPVSTDDRREGDDHIRGIKNVLRNTFPNLNGAVTATPEQLSGSYLPLGGGTVTGPMTAAGGITLGDAAGDALTIKSDTASIPNHLNFTDGGVGVGTTPSVALHVKSSAGAVWNETIGSVVSEGVYYQMRDNAGSAGYVGYGGFPNQLDLYNIRNGAVCIFTNNQERMRIDGVGNVGFGGAATNFGAGYVNVAIAAEHPVLDLVVNGTRTGNLQASTIDVRLSADTDVPLTFFTGLTERVRIEAAGVAVFKYGTKTQRTWQNVAGSRAIGGGPYTAPAYDIQIAVTGTTTGSSQGISLLINGVSIVSHGNGAGTGATAVDICGVTIPAGAMYQVTSFGGTVTLSGWMELR